MILVPPAGDASLQSLPRGLRPFSEEKGLKNLKRLFISLRVSGSACCTGVARHRVPPNCSKFSPNVGAAPHILLCCGENREALKVFLEVLEPFSSEKGSKPPEALAAKPRTPRGARQNAIASAKGLENGQSPFSLRFCDFRTTKITKSAGVLISRL